MGDRLEIDVEAVDWEISLPPTNNVQYKIRVIKMLKYLLFLKYVYYVLPLKKAVTWKILCLYTVYNEH